MLEHPEGGLGDTELRGAAREGAVGVCLRPRLGRRGWKPGGGRRGGLLDASPASAQRCPHPGSREGGRGRPGPLCPVGREGADRTGTGSPSLSAYGKAGAPKVGGRPEGATRPYLGTRSLHLPRTPRRPRRSSWPTRWRPEWRPGTTASLPSGLGARSVCRRRGPVADPALRFVQPRGPYGPPPPAPHQREPVSGP